MSAPMLDNSTRLLDYDAEKRSPEARRARKALIEYLLVKVDEGDWHGVSDAANDLRVLEAKSGW